MRIKILLNEFNMVNKFSNVAQTFISDIDLSNGRYVVNGKSLLGIYSLNLSTPVIAEIYSNDEKELKKFEKAMEEFRVD